MLQQEKVLHDEEVLTRVRDEPDVEKSRWEEEVAAMEGRLDDMQLEVAEVRRRAAKEREGWEEATKDQELKQVLELLRVLVEKEQAGRREERKREAKEAEGRRKMEEQEAEHGSATAS